MNLNILAGIILGGVASHTMMGINDEIDQFISLIFNIQQSKNGFYRIQSDIKPFDINSTKITGEFFGKIIREIKQINLLEIVKADKPQEMAEALKIKLDIAHLKIKSYSFLKQVVAKDEHQIKFALAQLQLLNGGGVPELEEFVKNANGAVDKIGDKNLKEEFSNLVKSLGNIQTRIKAQESASRKSFDR